MPSLTPPGPPGAHPGPSHRHTTMDEAEHLAILDLADAMESDSDLDELNGIEEVNSEDLLNAANILRRYATFKRLCT